MLAQRATRTVLLAVVLAAAALAGCASSEERIPDLALEVQDAEVREQPCLGGDEGEACHHVNVTVENRNEEASASLQDRVWGAQLADGATVDAYAVPAEADRLPAGETIQLEVLFQIGPEARIETLTYQDTMMPDPITAPVPGY